MKSNYYSNHYLTMLFRSIAISIVVMAYASVQAQNNHQCHPFVVDGKTWHCSSIPAYVKYQDYPFSESTYKISGDTVINDVAYKKVLCKDELFYGNAEFHYYTAVREEGCKVYSLEKEMEEEALLYDFSSPEERIPLTYGDLTFYRFSYMKEFNSTGDNRYVFTLGDEKGQSVKSTWVEAAGCIYEPFSFTVYSYSDTFANEAGVVPYYRRIVISCEENGINIFHIDDLAEPMSVSSVKTIPVSTDYFDLQGRRLSGKPQHGVYIQDGRKVVMR